MAQGPPELPESIVLQAFKGIKNTVSRERLTATDLEAAVNIDLDDAGQVRRRRGYALKLAGNFHSIKTIGGRVYGVKDGVLGIIRANYSFFSLGSQTGAPVCYTDVDGDVYFSGSSSGVITNEVVAPWGYTAGQGDWVSPVLNPTTTLGEISGKLLGDPPLATELTNYSGRIYLAQGKVLWATELFKYHYVDRTRNFMQFENDITLVMAMVDGIYVGTTEALYFLKGSSLGEFRLELVLNSPVLQGSGVWVPANMVHPQAQNGPIPTGEAAVFMTTEGICVGLDGGTCYNLTEGEVAFPRAVSGAALFRRDSGANSYVVAADSSGGPGANARIGDYVSAEVIRFGGA